MRVLEGDIVAVGSPRAEGDDLEVPRNSGAVARACGLVAQWVHAASEGSTLAGMAEPEEEQPGLPAPKQHVALTSINEDSPQDGCAAALSPTPLRAAAGLPPTGVRIRSGPRRATPSLEQREDGEDDSQTPEPHPDVEKASEWHLYLMREVARLSRRVDRSERMAHLNTVAGFKRVSSIFAEALAAERSNRLQDVEELRAVVEEVQAAAFATVSNLQGVEVGDMGCDTGSEATATLPPHAAVTVAAAVDSAAARLAGVVQIELDKRWSEVAAELDEYRQNVVQELSERQSAIVADLAKWQTETLYAFDVRAAEAPPASRAAAASVTLSNSSSASFPGILASSASARGQLVPARVGGGASCSALVSSGSGGAGAGVGGGCAGGGADATAWDLPLRSGTSRAVSPMPRGEDAARFHAHMGGVVPSAVLPTQAAPQPQPLCALPNAAAWLGGRGVHPGPLGPSGRSSSLAC